MWNADAQRTRTKCTSSVLCACFRFYIPNFQCATRQNGNNSISLEFIVAERN